jgi:hypothetical protein
MAADAIATEQPQTTSVAPEKAAVKMPLRFMDLSVDIKTLVIGHVCRISPRTASSHTVISFETNIISLKGDTAD